MPLSHFTFYSSPDATDEKWNGRLDRLGKKSKVCLRDKWPIRPALNSGFRSMKRLGILLLALGWDASPSQGYPQRYPFIHLGEERQCGIKFLV